MASGLSFFSSPPHPTSDPWQHPPSTFYTPQHTSKYNRTNIFAPTSPSPLRTSRNANLMSRPVHGGDIFKTTASEHTNENNTSATQTAQEPPTSNTTLPFPIDSANVSLVNTPSSLFTFTTPPPQEDTSTTDLPKPTFQFSSLAHSSTPTSLLQTHTKTIRDSRKRLFLDRLRNKRDDARSDRASDQVLRMDYMRERRAWEAEKERSVASRWGARSEDLDADADVDAMVDDGEEEVEGMSPTEDKEIEELADVYYDLQQQRSQREEGRGWRNGDGEDFDLEDDGYDEAFMEVLSQEVPAAQQGHGQLGDNGASGGAGSIFSVHEQQNQQNGGLTDFEMDIS